MDNDDVFVREGDAGVQFLEARIIPLLDLAEEDVCEDITGEDERLRDLRQVVGGHDRAERHGDVERCPSLGVLELRVVHRSIGRAEVGGLILMSLDSTAGTDSLVVDLEAGRLEIFLGPLAVEDRRERRARAVERLRGLRPRESRGQETCAECAECGEPPANLPSVHACHGWFAP